MTQPVPYDPSADFSILQAGDIGNALDAQFNDIKLTTDELITNIGLLQRDDGAVANAIIHPDSFSTASLALIASDWTPRGMWATATMYAIGDLVEESNSAYVAAVDHVSGVFANDHAAGKWVGFSGADSVATPYSLTLLAQADASSWLTTLGFSAFVKTLVDDTTAGAFLTTLGVTSFIQTLLDDANAATAAATLAVLPLSGGTITGTLNVNGTHTVTGTLNVNGVLNEGQGSDIASAATINLDTATGNIVRITGSTPISAVTLTNGRSRTVLFTTAGGQITFGASLVPPGGANFNWAANDIGIFSAIQGVVYFTPLNRWQSKLPTSQVFTSSSGTYTTPAGATRLRVRLVGGGSGGGGGPGGATASTAGNTTFGTFTANGGSGGSGGGGGGAGGAASGGTINISGGGGGGAGVNGVANVFMPGGIGGSSAFGGSGTGGSGNQNGANAAANSGSGGGGGGGGSAQNGGSGGGSGGYCEGIITNPAATYSYAVGAGVNGTAGATTTGGNGAAGIIVVEEFYD